ncbi:MAG TPA: DegV family protein [Longimicrobiales bacterium]|nr:DegV family protein [Longimicrobiales bacterium]
MRIEYIDGVRLRRALVAGCDFVQQRRAELNRINVFPVPDGDTGTNLALTAAAIADHLRSLDEPRLHRVAREAADAAILGARGNCGMILSHFLLGFADAAGSDDRLDAARFAEVLTAAATHVYGSLERPVEGTIITIMREVAEEAARAQTEDFADLLELLLLRARDSCARTPDMLPALRAAGVVDAGALGFVHMLEGVGAYMHGDPFTSLAVSPAYADVPSAVARVDYPAQSEVYRFCTEALVRGSALPDADTVRAWLREQGDSLIVIRNADVLKVHIHTDDPEGVFAYLRSLGSLVTHKAEDMAVQHAAVERAASSHVQLARRPISLVTDSACDLPDEIIRAHGIHVVPLMVVFEDEALRDRVDIDAGTFVERLRAGEHPTTSQPPPKAFLDAFQAAAEDGETVLAVVLSSALSGTFGSAEAAAKRLEAPLVLVDSLGASMLQGLLVLQATELAELGRNAHEIADELRRIRAQSGMFFTVDVFDNLLKSGRVGRGQVMIAGLLDIRPILEIGTDGKVHPTAKVRGRANVLPRVLAVMKERIPADAKRLRFAVVHVGCEDVAIEIAARLREEWGDREVIVAPASPVLATHLGIGAWGLAYQLQD